MARAAEAEVKAASNGAPVRAATSALEFDELTELIKCARCGELGLALAGCKICSRARPGRRREHAPPPRVRARRQRSNASTHHRPPAHHTPSAAPVPAPVPGWCTLPTLWSWS